MLGRQMSDVYQGQVLAGKYRVDQVLGSGGMGVVVAATHLHLEERVAIKFLLPQALANPESVARFAREARAAVKIKGEHVARVIDVGTLETGAPYLVMEYLEGSDLAALVRQRGALPISEAVDAVLQACEALAEAHALGIVHRDLKPANLFITRRPDGTTCVKVLDFGISKVVNPSASDNAMTKTTAVMGSPLYMSPEQMTASRDVDVRSDIWAIGSILYELLTARVPFLAETLPEICALILTVSPRAIRDFNPSVPEQLQNIVSRCLEKDRQRRFQNVSELARALSPFGSRATSRSSERISRILSAGGYSSSIDVEIPPQSEAHPETQATQSNFGRTQSSHSSTVPLVVGIALALLLVGGGALFLLLRAGKTNPESIPAAALSAAPIAPIAAAATPPSTAEKLAAVPGTALPAPAAPTTNTAPVAPAKTARKVVATAPPKPAPTSATSSKVATKPAPTATAQPAPAPAPTAHRSREELMSGRH